MTPLDEDWLSDSTAKWAIDVNGEMISVTAHLHPPYLPIIQQESLSFIYSFKHFIISSIFLSRAVDGKRFLESNASSILGTLT